MGLRDCKRVAHYEDLLQKYRSASGFRRDELRTELLRYLTKGVYVDRRATGAERSCRLLGIVEVGDDFFVEYSHNLTDEKKRMPLRSAVALIESADARYRMVYSDVA